MEEISGINPMILHSDKVCHCTSTAFGERHKTEAIKISWSKCKRCYDDISLERLWCSVKIEEVYPRAYTYEKQKSVLPAPSRGIVFSCHITRWEADLPMMCS